LAGVGVQGRLRVEALQVADPAGEEHPDDRLRLRREVRTWRAGSVSDRRASESVAGEHRPEGQPGEPEPHDGEERATTHGESPGQRMVRKSVWLNSARIRLSRALVSGSADGPSGCPAVAFSSAPFASNSSRWRARNRIDAAASFSRGGRPRT